MRIISVTSGWAVEEETSDEGAREELVDFGSECIDYLICPFHDRRLA